MESNHNVARTSGALYVVVIVAGYFSLMYIPSHIIVRGDALATTNNIVAHTSLFRWGIINDVINVIAEMLLPLALYKLLRPVNKIASVLMVLFALADVPLLFSGILDKVNVLSLVSGAESLHALTPDQLNAHVMLLLGAAHNDIFISIFWGLWLFPFGYLVFKSGFLPKTLGIFLVLGGFYYVAYFFASLVQVTVPFYAIAPDAIGEVGIGLWLLILGARRTVRKEPSVALPSN